MEETEQVIQQTILVLPYFDEEVPLVCLPDGLRYNSSHRSLREAWFAS